MAIDPALRKRVQERASHRCEYCQMHQDDEPFLQYHVEHILARQHGGQTVDSNLAFACHHCNLHKGPNLSGVDPLKGTVVRLFNPRTEKWSEHFERQGVTIAGLTPAGRATVRVLAMNAPKRLEVRSIARR